VERIVALIHQDPRYPDPPADWKANSHYRLPLPGAKSLLEAGERVASHLVARMNALRGEITSDSLKLFVGHGAAFRHAAFQLGILQFEQIAQLSMYHTRPVYLEYLLQSELAPRTRGAEASCGGQRLSGLGPVNMIPRYQGTDWLKVNLPTQAAPWLEGRHRSLHKRKSSHATASAELTALLEQHRWK